jgi:hypothetical protein
MRTGARKGLVPVALFGAALFGAGEAAAQTTFCQPVVAPWEAPNTTIAFGINNHGDVVGFYLDPISNPNGDENGVNRGFLLKDGVYSKFELGPTNTELYGINDLGQMVGETGAHAFVITNGVLSFLDIGAGPQTASGATDINNKGDIVGFRRDPPDFVQKGFVKTADGTLYTVVYPGIRHDTMSGINVDGLAVGSAADGFGDVTFTWTPATGPVPVPEFPGGYGTSLAGINNAKVAVGTFASPGDPSGGSFIRPLTRGGRPSRFACPNASSVGLLGINDQGAVVGEYGDAAGHGNHSFYTPNIRLLDPVPDFVRTARDVTADSETLARGGRDVQGIVADGVSQVLLRIPVASAGLPVTVTVYQDETTASTDEKRYGALGKPGGPCPGEGCTASTIVVQSVGTRSGAYAFVVYRAPRDFPRNDADAQLVYRDVALRIESGSSGAQLPLRVLRPPVAAVHGLFVTDALWNDFRPLVWEGGNDPRFTIFRINYGENVSSRIVQTNPPYPPEVRRQTLGSALGFDYNAGVVQQRIRERLQVFKTGNNPARMSVAAVQVDVVAHSMGGDITRYMPLRPDFLLGNTYGQGIVHKLVTLDTPHKGSVLATALISQMAAGHYCVPQELLGKLGGSVVLRAVTLSDVGTVNGAVRDLNQPSLAIQRMDSQAIHSIPTATVVGIYTNWGALGSVRTSVARNMCKGDALGEQLRPDAWPALFGEPTDGTVQKSSQDPIGTARSFSGYVHSSGMVSLGFSPPTIVSSANGGEVATHVISLLNKPVFDGQTYRPLP